MADSDALYHRLFSHPLMVEQLVREFVPEAMAAGRGWGRGCSNRPMSSAFVPSRLRG